ncbi:MAG: periplasmic heavy metal sensor [Pseudorhodobacter sp.]|nr:periplasmic heavy metal sensor [Pseudorhodobacter sp.]
MTAPQMPRQSSRGLKIALAVSVAINLGVAGLVAGLALNDGPGGHGDKLVRDMGFGPYDPVLSPEDRTALRHAIVSRLGDFKSVRQQMQADMGAILSALRADPYIPDAVSAAFDAQAQHLTARLTLGNTVVRDYLLALPTEARLKFADRLDQVLHRGPGDSRPKPADGN